ncbi:hypothetical protein Leryth_002884, partial [Lithospermum erythrorhizon]
EVGCTFQLKLKELLVLIGVQFVNTNDISFSKSFSNR